MNFCPKCEKGIKNCWNQQSSQNECSCNGNSCNANETCCEPSCLSCLDENVKACIVCKQFIAGIYPSQKCVETCPYRSYEVILILLIASDHKSFSISVPQPSLHFGDRMSKSQH